VFKDYRTWSMQYHQLTLAVTRQLGQLLNSRVIALYALCDLSDEGGLYTKTTVKTTR
jgi:hypothetical protein